MAHFQLCSELVQGPAFGHEPALLPIAANGCCGSATSRWKTLSCSRF